MAIAPSKLGQFILREGASDDALLRRLREVGLLRSRASDDKVTTTFKKARDKDASLSKIARAFNSSEERIRVFLKPYLSRKGRRWAVPLDSLDLPDE